MNNKQYPRIACKSGALSLAEIATAKSQMFRARKNWNFLEIKTKVHHIRYKKLDEIFKILDAEK